METLENQAANKKEIPPELEADSLIDNYGNDGMEMEKSKMRLKELCSKNPDIREECIKKLEGDAGDLSILRDKIKDPTRPVDERRKRQVELKNKTELFNFLKSL